MAIQMTKIKELRLSKKLKQSDIGEAPHISRIESGYISDIPLRTLERIAKKLNMKAWKLVKYCEVSE